MIILSLSPVTTPVKHIVYFSEHIGRKMQGHARGVVSRLPSKSHTFCVHSGGSQPRYVALDMSTRSFSISGNGFQAFKGCLFKQRTNSDPLMKNMVRSISHRSRCCGISLPCQNITFRRSLPKQGSLTKIRWNMGSSSWLQVVASTGVFFGLSICFLNSEPVYVEASRGQNNGQDDPNSSSVGFNHGKKVYTNYAITGIPGDGRCLFRSVAHGACLRSGKPSPSESLQRQLADDLRTRVVNEFVKRREETEWFIEGDFDTYISQMRKPHVWGGEPELLMSSHVLQMPITVYMHDKKAGGLIAIAEYGQEYGKDNPIKVLYHGFGHYDALQIPGKGGQSRF